MNRKINCSCYYTSRMNALCLQRLKGLSLRKVPCFASSTCFSTSTTSNSNKSRQQKIVTVSEGKEKLFMSGNPMVYDKAITTVTGNPIAGDVVLVADVKGNVFARGFYNPLSLFRVRLIVNKDEKIFSKPIEVVIKERINDAIRLRKVMNLPSERTNVYRLVNGEGDKLSGLMVDVLGDTVVVQSSCIWCERHSDLIKNALQDFITKHNLTLIWRQSVAHLKQDGFVFNSPLDAVNVDDEDSSEDSAVSVKKSTEKGSAITTSPTAVTNQLVVENEIKFKLNAQSDQKTGFYCDQRENRQLIKRISENKTVLDTYCYTGGFAMNAVLGGAAHVTAVDSSLHAITSAKENMQLNGISEDKLQFVEGDCVAVMKALVEQQKHFDLVICDPPKLAPSRQYLSRATKKYLQINTLAMRLVEPSGGLLYTCSCSAIMSLSEYEFTNMLQAAAKQANRQITILSKGTAGSDHPVQIAYPEGKYLTTMLLYVS